MIDRYRYHEFYTGKENELAYQIVQSPTYKNINSENLFIQCLSPAVIKKGSEKEKTLIAEWDEIFQTLDKVKRLKINIFNQEILNVLHKIPNLTELIIENSSVEDVSPLSKLEQLTRLEIYHNTKLTDIASIGDLHLKQLKFENCFNIVNYEVIGTMKSLKGLSLNGNWTAPKNLKINSLVPFERLESLEHLDLDYAIVVDKSFESILRMTKLKRFDYLATIKKETRIKIKTNHKALVAGFFMDYDYEKHDFYEGKIW
ncbi:leucine-rich repeat domain-containing protein [Flavobacterium sp.]|uniref:leucine-rich repeat domain-containing protein n=1 Tax=Flavobacterium sp. TaxID=239 RepID=UPI002605E06B|nr:leucine-rich repeat domain-containing protein [Flavobacterium sp.]